MTQMLLVADADTATLPHWIRLQRLQDDPFLSQAGAHLFDPFGFVDLATVTIEEKDFDDVFVDAQRGLSMGEPFSSSLLHDAISLLAQNSAGIAVWYGSDYEELERVPNVESLLAKIQEGLLHPSVEAYALLINS